MPVDETKVSALRTALGDPENQTDFWVALLEYIYNTRVADVDTFTLDAVTEATISVRTESEEITLNGDADTVIPLVIRGDGDPQIQVNEGSWASEAIARTGDVIKVRLTASDLPLTEYVATLYLPSKSVEFSVTTQDAYDVDAQAFLTAASIVDVTIGDAVSDLVVALKAAGIWTKFLAIYPFVGGTASTHKWNLKNPVDSDGAYRLTFTGGWTHSPTGADPNGSTGYADTHLAPTAMSQNSICYGAYTRTATNGGTVIIGASQSTRYTNIYPYYQPYGIFAEANDGSLTYTNSTSIAGLTSVSRTSSTNKYVQRNATQTTVTESSSGTVANSFYISCSNVSGTPNWFSADEIAFAHIGQSLSNAELAALYTIVQNFQTALSRQV